MNLMLWLETLKQYIHHLIQSQLLGNLQPMKQHQFQPYNMLDEPEYIGLFSSVLNQEQRKISILDSPSQKTQHQFKTSLLKTPKKSKKDDKGQSQKPKKVKNLEQKNPNQNFGHWSLEENKRYHWFLEIHNSHFLLKHLRRMDKIFKTMARFVGSREAEQCRSHHQKMQKKYHHSFSTILLNLRLQHYNSQDQNLIEDDLKFYSIQHHENLLSASRLHEQINHRIDSPQLNADSDNSGEQQKQGVCSMLDRYQNGSEYPLQQIQTGINIDDLFGEQFQHNLF